MAGVVVRRCRGKRAQGPVACRRGKQIAEADVQKCCGDKGLAGDAALLPAIHLADTVHQGVEFAET